MERRETSALEDWIAAGRRGDPDAIDQLCRYFEQPATRYVMRRMWPSTRRWCDPEAVAQQALFETMQSLATLPEGAGEDAVLQRLQRNAHWQILMEARRNRRTVGESALENGMATRDEEGPSTGPVTRNDEKEWLRAFVERLPESYRDVVGLSLDGLAPGEIAERLELSSEAVRKRLERAREALARTIAGRADG